MAFQRRRTGVWDFERPWKAIVRVVRQSAGVLRNWAVWEVREEATIGCRTRRPDRQQRRAACQSRGSPVEVALFVRFSYDSAATAAGTLVGGEWRSCRTPPIFAISSCGKEDGCGFAQVIFCDRFAGGRRSRLLLQNQWWTGAGTAHPNSTEPGARRLQSRSTGWSLRLTRRHPARPGRPRPAPRRRLAVPHLSRQRPGTPIRRPMRVPREFPGGTYPRPPRQHLLHRQPCQGTTGRMATRPAIGRTSRLPIEGCRRRLPCLPVPLTRRRRFPVRRSHRIARVASLRIATVAIQGWARPPRRQVPTPTGVSMRGVCPSRYAGTPRRQWVRAASPRQRA